MQVAAAQVPPFQDSEDKIYVTRDTIIMLDGASAFTQAGISTSNYAECLGQNLCNILDGELGVSLQAGLAAAIDQTSRELRLSRGRSPSSTVTVVRRVGDVVEFLLLGDNLIAFPDVTVSDDRIARVGIEERQEYQRRLTSGTGYDRTHRAAMRELQRRQAASRNQEGGYWIAEADPSAADHAIVGRRSLAQSPWAVLATDGAYKTMAHLGLDDWNVVRDANRDELTGILHQCQQWEAISDPDGRELPRAKRHDDKSLATIFFSD